MEFSTEVAALILLCCDNVSLKLKPEKRGVHKIIKARREFGEYHHLFRNLKSDPEKLFSDGS